MDGGLEVGYFVLELFEFLIIAFVLFLFLEGTVEVEVELALHASHGLDGFEFSEEGVLVVLLLPLALDELPETALLAGEELEVEGFNAAYQLHLGL